MSLFLRSTLLANCLLAVAAIPQQQANACEPPEPGITQVAPDGESHPGNAAVRIWGYDLDINQVVVTVDGVAAQAVPVVGPAEALAPIVFTIDPMPEPDAVVHLSGELCQGNDQCTLDTTFTATAPDGEGPATATNLVLDLHEYPNIDPGAGSCLGGSDFTYWLSFAQDEGGPHALVELFPENEPDNTLTWRVISATEYGFRVYEQAFEGFDLGDICARVTPFDLALHQGTASEVCGLCNYREDTEVDDPWTNPAKPTWSSGDIWPGGPCDSGVETTDGSETDTTGGDSETDATQTGPTGNETDGTSETETTGDGTSTDTNTSTSGGTEGPGSDSATDSDTGLITDKGCGCRSSGDSPVPLLAGCFALLWLRRRRG